MSTPWVADPVIGWRILLVAELAQLPSAAELGARLSRLYADQGWAETLVPGIAHAVQDPRELAASLDGRSPAPLLIGTAGRSLVLSGHHRDMDGLGLLSVLSALTGHEVTSSASGGGQRPRRSYAMGVVRRLGEAVLAPPAGVDLARPTEPCEHDSLVAIRTGRQLRTDELVLAGVAAVQDVRRTRGSGRARAQRVAISVGVGRPAPDARIADRSELLRMRRVTSLTPVRELLRTAPLEPAVGRTGATGGSRRPANHVATSLMTGLMTSLMARLRPRLGSTLLVSHLGDVTAPGVVSIEFYPVTAAGSGLSVGAATLEGRTCLTARARGYDVAPSGLARLLAAVVTAAAAAGPGEGSPIRP